MRQVAVATEYQGQGVGGLLVDECERWSRKNGFTRIELNARETAVHFYDRLGYHVEAEPFVEVGIPHRRMFKNLDLLP